MERPCIISQVQKALRIEPLFVRRAEGFRLSNPPRHHSIPVTKSKRTQIQRETKSKLIPIVTEFKTQIFKNHSCNLMLISPGCTTILILENPLKPSYSQHQTRRLTPMVDEFSSTILHSPKIKEWTFNSQFWNFVLEFIKIYVKEGKSGLL